MFGRISGQVVRDAARGALEAEHSKRTQDPYVWWLTRGAFVLVLVAGWLFIAWENEFHVTAPLLFVCIAYLAVLATIVNLWRTGAAVAAPGQEGDEAWERPIGPRAELEKDKRTLLKAIKETQFDQEMGKLAPEDADELIQMYRAKAIAVIKELDRLEAAGDETGVRAQIEREVKARLAVAAKAKKGKKAGKGKAKGKDRDRPQAKQPAKQPSAPAVAVAVEAAEAAEVARANEDADDEAEVEASAEAAASASAAPASEASAAPASEASAAPASEASAEPAPDQPAADAVSKRATEPKEATS